MSVVTEPLPKRLARRLYGMALGFHARVCGAPRRDGVAIYYGGAHTTKLGGPALKLAKLADRFPEDTARFSLVYLLSNMPYLPQSALESFRRRRLPMVLNQNGVFYPAWYGGDWQARNAEMARAYHAADWVLWQSTFCKRAAERFLGERAGPGEILANAVDTEAFHPGERPDGGRFRFLLTGRVDAHQPYRLTHAIKALAVARSRGLDAELLAAGSFEAGVVGAALQLAESEGVAGAVTLRGPYAPADAPALYRDADAYVTLTHQDACPTGVIEALASGLPVVHPDNGGTPELVGFAGCAVPAEENWDRQVPVAPEAVADAMLDVAGRRPLLSAMARKRAEERFSLLAWLNHHERLFERLLAERGR